MRFTRVEQFVRFDSCSHRRGGNVETRVLCGFPSSEGEQKSFGGPSIIPPSERHFPQRGPSLSAILARMCRLGGRRSGNRCVSETRVECTLLQILAQSRNLEVRLRTSDLRLRTPLPNFYAPAAFSWLRYHSMVRRRPPSKAILGL
jgi:hypothetical protein